MHLAPPEVEFPHVMRLWDAFRLWWSITRGESPNTEDPATFEEWISYARGNVLLTWRV